MRIGYILVVIVFTGGCVASDPLAYRMMADYLPLRTAGDWWTYTDGEGRRMHLEVAGDSVVLNRACKVLERDYEREFWFRGGGEVARYVQETLEINAQDVVVEERWRPWLKLPLVLGNSWKDTFRKETVAFGDTILREVEISGRVVSRESLSVPAGEFDQCYRVEILLTELTESKIFGEAFQRRVFNEWYAGDVGLLRFEDGGNAWELESYELR